MLFHNFNIIKKLFSTNKKEMERYNQNQEVNRNNIPYNTIIPQSFEN